MRIPKPYSALFLEEGVRPRRPAALLVLAVGQTREGTAVDRGAAGRVRHDHAVAEQLADQFDVRSFTAAGAGAAELEVRTQELRTLDRRGVGSTEHVVRQREEEIRHWHPDPRHASFRRVGHADRLLLGRAGLDADAAAGAVLDEDLETELQPRLLDRLRIDHLEGGRRSGQIRLANQLGADRGVRTRHHALVALNALRRIPLRHARSDAALLILRGGGRHRAVVAHRRNRNVVTLLMENRLHQRVGEGSHFRSDGLDRFESGNAVERRRDLDLLEHRQRAVDAHLVLLDDLVALLLELLLDSSLDVVDRVIGRNDVGQLEEAGLHDGRNILRTADLKRELQRIDRVDLDMLLEDRLLHVAGEAFEHLVGREFAVIRKVPPSTMPASMSYRPI